MPALFEQIYARAFCVPSASIFCLHSGDQEGRQPEKPLSDSGPFATPQSASDSPEKQVRDPAIAGNNR